MAEDLEAILRYGSMTAPTVGDQGLLEPPDPVADALVCRCLDDTARDVRVAALRVINRRRMTDAIPKILGLVSRGRRSQGELRLMMTVLGRLAQDRAPNLFARLLMTGGTPELVRLLAAEALFELGTHEAQARLVVCAREEGLVAEACRRLLGFDPRALPDENTRPLPIGDDEDTEAIERAELITLRDRQKTPIDRDLSVPPVRFSSETRTAETKPPRRRRRDSAA